MHKNIPYLTLSEVVDEYLASNFNNDQKYYENYLIHAKWVWKKLFRDTLIDIKSRYLPIDKTTTPHSVVLPLDIIRFLSISFADKRGKIVQLTRQDSMNTTPLPAAGSKACGCKQCDCNEPLCGSANNFQVRTEAVIIDGTTYTNKYWSRKNAAGDVHEVRQVWIQDYYNSDNYEVKMIEEETKLCSLDVKPCGCVKATIQNKELLCGCAGYVVVQENCGLDAFEGFEVVGGYFKIDKSGRVFLKAYNADITHAIISYQSNGECPYEEILVPEIAVDAMHTGIHWRVRALSSGYNRLEAREARRAYNVEVTELDEFLQPVLMEEFLAVQGLIPKWGGGHAGEGTTIIPKITTNVPGASLSEVKILLETTLAKIGVASGGVSAVQPPFDPGLYAYVHHQDFASNEWTIIPAPQLGFFPNITLVDAGGNKIEGTIQYVSMNKYIARFSEPLTGFAYCS